MGSFHQVRTLEGGDDEIVSVNVNESRDASEGHQQRSLRGGPLDGSERVISGGQLATFVVASLVIIIVPGPSVLFTLARGIAWGRAVAVLTVLGNCLGTLILSVIVAVGLGPLLAHSKALSIVLQLIGGGYLIWLGIGAMRHRHEHATCDERTRSRPTATTPPSCDKGYMVGVLNPKVAGLLRGGVSALREPVEGQRHPPVVAPRCHLYGLAFCSDSTWGIIAGTAREWLSGSPQRLVVMREVGACVMMILGLVIIVSALVS